MNKITRANTAVDILTDFTLSILLILSKILSLGERDWTK